MGDPALTAGTVPRLVAVVGPTATGKTDLAVALARHLRPADLLNADSRQVIRGLEVGTCRPSAAQLHGVACHLLDLCEPGERFTVAQWAAAARGVLAEMDAGGRRGILVGGTGLYVSALVDGLAFAGVPPDPARRAEREARAAEPGGVEALAAELVRRDPAAAAGLDLRNPRRVVRALEILDAGGSPGRRGRVPGRPAVLIGIDAPPDLHARLVEERARRMLDGGALLDEVRAALARGVSPAGLDRCGIGYREAMAVVDGRVSVADAVDALALRTRRYARAQRTWFRRDGRIRWLRLEEGAGPPVAEALRVIRAAEGAEN